MSKIIHFLNRFSFWQLQYFQMILISSLLIVLMIQQENLYKTQLNLLEKRLILLDSIHSLSNRNLLLKNKLIQNQK